MFEADTANKEETRAFMLTFDITISTLAVPSLSEQSAVRHSEAYKEIYLRITKRRPRWGGEGKRDVPPCEFCCIRRHVFQSLSYRRSEDPIIVSGYHAVLDSMADNDQYSTQFPELERMQAPDQEEGEEGWRANRHMTTTRMFSMRDNMFGHSVEETARHHSHHTSSSDRDGETNLSGLDAETSERVREILRKKGLEGIDEHFATLPVPAVVLAQALGELPEQNEARRSDRFSERNDGSGGERSISPRRMSKLNPNFQPDEFQTEQSVRQSLAREKNQINQTTATTSTPQNETAIGTLHKHTDGQKKVIILLALARASLHMNHPEKRPLPLTPDQLTNQHRALIALKQDLDTVQHQIAQLSSEKEMVAQKLDEANARIDRFKQQIAQQMQEKWGMQKEREIMREKTAELESCKSRIAELESQIQSIQVQQEHSSNPIPQSEPHQNVPESPLSLPIPSQTQDPSHIQTLITALKHSYAHCRTLQQQIFHKETRILALEPRAQGYDRIKAEPREYFDSYRRLLQDQNSQVVKVEKLEKEVDEWRRRCEELEQRWSEGVHVLRGVEERLRGAEEAFKRAEEEVERLVGERDMWCAKYEEQCSETASLQQSFDNEVAARREDLQRYHKAISTQKASFQTREKELKHRIAGEKTRCEEVGSLLKELQERYDVLETASHDTISRLEAQIASTTTSQPQPQPQNGELYDLYAKLAALETENKSLDRTLRETLHIKRIYHHKYGPLNYHPSGSTIPMPTPPHFHRSHRKFVPTYETSLVTRARKEKLATLRATLTADLEAERRAFEVLDLCREAVDREFRRKRGVWGGRNLRWLEMGMEERWGVRVWLGGWGVEV